MKNVLNKNILAEINEKITDLENSFVELPWISFNSNVEDDDFIGLEGCKKKFYKVSYTFSPLS